MTSYDEAIQLVSSNVKALAVEAIPVLEALSRVTAKVVSAKIALPPFNNSAMDGFALRSEEVCNASSDNPVELNVADEVIAGDQIDEAKHAQAVAIMTGAVLSKQFDAVIPIENVEVLEKQDNKVSKIKISEPVASKTNVRFAGEDFSVGDPVLEPGVFLTAQHIKALTALGISKVDVYKRPRVAVIGTGNEISDQYDKALEAGQIYNSNTPYLVSFLIEMNAEVALACSVEDKPDVFKKVVETLVDKGVDLIISTGAVSMGVCDFIPKSIEELGGQCIFHKWNCRPGFPAYFAKLKETSYLGLPGNPASTAACMYFLGYPILQKLLGQKSLKPMQAQLVNNSKKKAKFSFFRKARYYSEAGQLKVEILKGQESFKIKPFLEMNAWAVLPEGKSEFAAGELIDIYPI